MLFTPADLPTFFIAELNFQEQVQGSPRIII